MAKVCREGAGKTTNPGSTLSAVVLFSRTCSVVRAVDC